MKSTRKISLLVIFAAVVFLTACRTLDYRSVQADFERAVQAEQAGNESPYVDWYQNVSTTLTDAYIGKLDPKLRPNALMLRSTAEWRSRQYEESKASAANGLTALEQLGPEWANSRDAILLTMLPGLIQDSQLRDRLATNPPPLRPDLYRSTFEKGFSAALKQMAEAHSKFGTATPPAVTHFWNYHAWRILQNWNFTLAQLAPAEANTTEALADADALIKRQFTSLNWTSLPNAIETVKQAIPEAHPYRKLIALEEQR